MKWLALGIGKALRSFSFKRTSMPSFLFVQGWKWKWKGRGGRALNCLPSRLEPVVIMEHATRQDEGKSRQRHTVESRSWETGFSHRYITTAASHNRIWWTDSGCCFVARAIQDMDRVLGINKAILLLYYSLLVNILKCRFGDGGGGGVYFLSIRKLRIVSVDWLQRLRDVHAPPNYNSSAKAKHQVCYQIEVETHLLLFSSTSICASATHWLVCLFGLSLRTSCASQTSNEWTNISHNNHSRFWHIR